MSPGTKTWLRILANLLGAFVALVVYANPRAVFNSEYPITFLLLFVSVALWAGLWITGVRGPLAGGGRVLELGGLLASLILVAFCLTKIPSVHDRLLVREHEGKGP